VELGTKNASSLEPTIALVNRYQSTKRFLVTSFLHPLVLDLVNRTSAEGGLLVAHRPLNTGPAVASPQNGGGSARP
jgi:hypothetical protein